MHDNEKIQYHKQTTLQHILIRQTISKGQTSGATNKPDLEILVTLLVTP